MTIKTLAGRAGAAAARIAEPRPATVASRIVAHLDGKPAEAPTLRSIAHGGAGLSHPVLIAVLNAFANADAANASRRTESASTVTTFGPEDHRPAVAGNDPAVRARLVSAGRLIDGIQAHIRCEDGSALPGGEVGELGTRDPQVSREHLRGSIVIGSEGWSPTQDRARVYADGHLLVGGGADDTIVRSAENIASAEIEDALVGDHDVAALGVPGRGMRRSCRRPRSALVRYRPRGVARPRARRFGEGALWIGTCLATSSYRHRPARCSDGALLDELMG
jgi:acyl-CoA synthetase (AMP-forming)/AMP-acid ligase II